MIAGRARVLAVDDDPVSLRFLCIALEQAGCVAVPAASDAAARALAPVQRFELLLIDRNLDGCSGVDLLRALRECGVSSPAIATSAEIDAHLRESLLREGFVDTLAKPATLATVREIVARHVGLLARANAIAGAPTASAAAEAVLDDAGALAAIGGDAGALTALRRLFHAELEVLLAVAAPVDAARLHRLRASCGFCGAAALASAAAALQRAIERNEDTQAASHAFFGACAAARSALAQRDPSLAAT